MLSLKRMLSYSCLTETSNGNITRTKTNHNNMYLLNKVEANRSTTKNEHETVLKSFYSYYDEGKKGK